VFNGSPIRIEKDFRARFELTQLTMEGMEIVDFIKIKTMPNTLSDGIARSPGAVIQVAGRHRAKIMSRRFLVILKRVTSFIACLGSRDELRIGR
jgi:ATP-dependent protease ClpP protease subunit